MNPAFRFDGIQEDRVENGTVLFPWFDPGAKGESPQGIHDLGDIDVIWASNAASIAGSADPNRFGTQDLFPMIVLNVTKNLIREDIHGISYWAAC